MRISRSLPFLGLPVSGRFPARPLRPTCLPCPRLRSEPIPERGAFSGKFVALHPTAYRQARLTISFPTSLANPDEEAKRRVSTVLRPETDLERQIVEHPDYVAGMNWGDPRPGHPEGNVQAHILRILMAIDECVRNPERSEFLASPHVQRSDLRILALLHDAFKLHQHTTESPLFKTPHFALATAFGKLMGLSSELRRILELHDFYYFITQDHHKRPNLDHARVRMEALIAAVNWPLYWAFIHVDRLGGDGDLSSIIAFQSLAGELGVPLPS